MAQKRKPYRLLYYYRALPQRRKGRCFRPINLLGRTSNFSTFKSFLMSRGGMTTHLSKAEPVSFFQNYLNLTLRRNSVFDFLTTVKILIIKNDKVFFSLVQEGEWKSAAAPCTLIDIHRCRKCKNLPLFLQFLIQIVQGIWCFSIQRKYEYY